MAAKERFIEGFELYQESLERMKSGIRYRHPEFDEQQVMDKINANMKLIRDQEMASLPEGLTPWSHNLKTDQSSDTL